MNKTYKNTFKARFSEIEKFEEKFVGESLFDVKTVQEKISLIISILFDILNDLMCNEIDGRLITRKLKLVNKIMEECEKEVYKFFDHP